MRSKQLYGLFLKVNGKWVRQWGSPYTKDNAIRVYQTRLLNHFILGDTVALRPVKDNGGI